MRWMVAWMCCIETGIQSTWHTTTIAISGRNDSFLFIFSGWLWSLDSDRVIVNEEGRNRFWQSLTAIRFHFSFSWYFDWFTSSTISWLNIEYLSRTGKNTIKPTSRCIQWAQTIFEIDLIYDLHLFIWCQMAIVSLLKNVIIELI